MARPKKKETVEKAEVSVPETGVPAETAAEAFQTLAQADVTAQSEAPATFTQEQVQAMIAEAVAKATQDAVAQAMAKQQQPQIIQVAQDAEKVHFLFQAEVSDENIYEIGPQGMYGRIIGKTGSFFVPKSDLSRVMDAMFRLLLEKRWIIAVDGLTDDEREAYGVAYKEGELLDKKAFAKMVELGDEILDIYPKLCAGHREMVAKRYHEAYMNKSVYVKREVVVALNSMSKKFGSKDGDFVDIIEAMNAADVMR